MARLDCLARYAFVLALTAAAWSGCGGKSSGGSTGTAGAGGVASGDAGAGGSIATGGGGIAGGDAGIGGSTGSAGAAGGGAGGGAGGNAGNGGTGGSTGGTGGAPCAQDGGACDFPDITCYYEMHQAGQQNNYYGCTCNRGDAGPSRYSCCFVGNAFNPNGILTPATMPDWWLTPSGSQWRCPSGS